MSDLTFDKDNFKAIPSVNQVEKEYLTDRKHWCEIRKKSCDISCTETTCELNPLFDNKGKPNIH